MWVEESTEKDGEKNGRVFWSLFYRHWLSSKAPPPSAITLEVMIQSMNREWGENTHKKKQFTVFPSVSYLYHESK